MIPKRQFIAAKSRQPHTKPFLGDERAFACLPLEGLGGTSPPSTLAFLMRWCTSSNNSSWVLSKSTCARGEQQPKKTKRRTTKTDVRQGKA